MNAGNQFKASIMILLFLFILVFEVFAAAIDPDELNKNKSQMDNKNKGKWLSAGELKPGMKVLGANGKWIEITGIETVKRNVKTYNLEVKDNHTYTVGKDGVVAHNQCFISVAGLPNDKEIGENKLDWGARVSQAINIALYVLPLGAVIERALVRFGANDLVIGLNQYLSEFMIKRGGKAFMMFKTSGTFAERMIDAMTQTSKIRVNLTGVNMAEVTQMSGTLDALSRPVYGYTNYELWLIKSNPAFKAKSVFYNNGKVVPSPF